MGKFSHNRFIPALAVPSSVAYVMRTNDYGRRLGTGPNLSRRLRCNPLSRRERARVRGWEKEFLLLVSLILIFSRREKGPKCEALRLKTRHFSLSSNCSLDPQNPGFTLLEVVVSLTLLSILLAIVSLQLRPLLAQTHLYDTTRQMVANLQYVRMKAVSQNRRLRVTFRPATQDYVVDRDEEGVWRRQLLHSHSAEEVNEAAIPLPRDVRITTVNSGGDVIFLPRGAVDGGISITLGTANGGETRRVVVNLAGRVRTE